MNPWIIIILVMASVIFRIDYLLRKKKWKDNSKKEKISLLVNMFSVGPYIFLSVLGALCGIVSYSPETAFGSILYNTTLVMAEFSFIVAAIAVIASLILRKKGKTKSSILVNVIALAYIVIVLVINSIAGKML
jgi:hypothetical protein